MITVSFCISRSIDLDLPGNNEREIIEEFKKSPFYKFSWVITCITCISTLIGLIVADTFMEILTPFWSFEIGIVISALLSGLASKLYVFMYDTATLDLKTGNFKASADFSDAKEPFILITTVNPLDKPKEDNEE
jgi:hypothetical protein